MCSTHLCAHLNNVEQDEFHCSGGVAAPYTPLAFGYLLPYLGPLGTIPTHPQLKCDSFCDAVSNAAPALTEFFTHRSSSPSQAHRTSNNSTSLWEVIIAYASHSLLQGRNHIIFFILALNLAFFS